MPRGRKRSMKSIMAEQELDKLKLQVGNVTPDMVVESARDPKSPLHDYFTWDDTAAADRWRIQEARLLISRVKVYHQNLQMRVRSVSSVKTQPAKPGSQFSLAVPSKTPQQRETSVRTALREMDNLRARYGHLQELTLLWAALDETEEFAL